jgi:peptidoglycan/xylan/chitin deacetylase (PgdA/CDA1 family)
MAKPLLNWVVISFGMLIYRLGLGGWLIQLNSRSPRVLMYHACEDRENDFTQGLSINTTPSQLVTHLEFLMRHYRIVPVAEALAEISGEPTVVFTFDDGFRSVYENVWPLLSERSLPATCYLTTDVIGNHGLIWINELNWFFHHHAALTRTIFRQHLGLETSELTSAVVRILLERYDAKRMSDLLKRLRQETGVDPQELAQQARLYLDWDQIGEMSSGGMTFGNHTASHPPLARLSSEDCRGEIQKASSALGHLPGAGETLAYPFGSKNETTREIALALGNRSLLEVEGLNSPLDPTRIGRIKVGSHSAAELFSRMEVLEPVKAWLKRLIGRRTHLGRSQFL